MDLQYLQSSMQKYAFYLSGLTVVHAVDCTNQAVFELIIIFHLRFERNERPTIFIIYERILWNEVCFVFVLTDNT